MNELLVDTSNEALSIAITKDKHLISDYVARGHRNHSIALMPMLTSMMEQASLVPNDIDQFVIAKGPGSYTGLRIGMSTLKMMAYTLNKPLKLVSSLQLLAMNVPSGVVIPLMDARRQNVYAAVINRPDNTYKMPDQHISLDSLLDYLVKIEGPLIFNGDAYHFKEQIYSRLPHATIIEDEYMNLPHAYYMSHLDGEIVTGEAIHHVIPSYLKQVEAEEKWRQTHEETEADRLSYVEQSR